MRLQFEHERSIQTDSKNIRFWVLFHDISTHTCSYSSKYTRPLRLTFLQDYKFKTYVKYQYIKVENSYIKETNGSRGFYKLHVN